MDCGTETKAASWKITSMPRTASSTREASRKSPSRISKRSPLNCRVKSSRFSRFPVLKFSNTRTDSPGSSKVRTICAPMNPPPPVTRYFMLSPCTSQDSANRTQNNLEIHPKRPMFDVIKIVFDFDCRFSHAGYISIIDLYSTGGRGFDEQTRSIKRHLPLIISHQLGPLRPRTYETHFSTQ